MLFRSRCCSEVRGVAQRRSAPLETTYRDVSDVQHYKVTENQRHDAKRDVPRAAAKKVFPTRNRIDPPQPTPQAKAEILKPKEPIPRCTDLTSENVKNTMSETDPMNVRTRAIRAAAAGGYSTRGLS